MPEQFYWEAVRDALREEIAKLEAEVEGEMAAAERFALEESPYPDPSELTQDVYAEWREGEMGLEQA